MIVEIRQGCRHPNIFVFGLDRRSNYGKIDAVLFIFHDRVLVLERLAILNDSLIRGHLYEQVRL